MKKFDIFLSEFLDQTQQKVFAFLLILFVLGKFLDFISYQGNNSVQEQKRREDALKTNVKVVWDVRTATVQELKMVPGIGEKTAAKIVELRSKFVCLEDLQMVRGIGPVKFAKLKEYFLPFGEEHQKKVKQEKKDELEYDKQVELVDLNRAGLNELTSVKGIGKVTAQRIIDYRTKNGKFATAKDLLKIKGIGQKKLGVILPQVLVK